MTTRETNRKKHPAAYRPAAIGVGIKLRSHREQRGAKLRPLSESIGLYAQLLSNWELGIRLPGPTEAAFVLGKLEVDYSIAQRVINLAIQGNIPDLVDTDHRDHAAIGWHYEHLADQTTVWAPTLIPDLLRTPEHDLSVLNHPLADAHAEAYAFALRQRREDIADPQRHYTFFIGTTALSTCPPQLVHDQLAYLQKLDRHSNITISIVPAEVCPPGLIAPFSLFETDSTTIAAVVHHYHASTYITDSDALSRYRETVTRLRNLHLITVGAAAEHLRLRAPLPASGSPELGSSAFIGDDDSEAGTPSDRPRDDGLPPRTAAAAEPYPCPMPLSAPSPSAEHHGDNAGSQTHPVPLQAQDQATLIFTPGQLVLGKQVARLRTARGLAQDRLATATGVALSRIRKLEHARTAITALADIAALADVLGVSRIEMAAAALHDFHIHFDLHPTTPQDTSTISDTTTSRSLGNWVCTERKTRGLTLDDVALRSGIPRETLALLENNDLDVTLPAIIKVADALRISRQALTIVAVSGFPRRPARGQQQKSDL
ncbi:Scr1 family TA system antitoxin-like transcriptional regulator [Amycolatopsis sp. NPDC003861]